MLILPRRLTSPSRPRCPLDRNRWRPGTEDGSCCRARLRVGSSSLLSTNLAACCLGRGRLLPRAVSTTGSAGGAACLPSATEEASFSARLTSRRHAACHSARSKVLTWPEGLRAPEHQKPPRMMRDAPSPEPHPARKTPPVPLELPAIS